MMLRKWMEKRRAKRKVSTIVKASATGNRPLRAAAVFNLPTDIGQPDDLDVPEFLR